MEDQPQAATSDNVSEKAVISGCPVQVSGEESAEPDEEKGFVGGRYTSGLKAPPPSPVREMQHQTEPRLAQRPKPVKHRKQASFGSKKERRSDAGMRNSFTALSRSKSGTITLAAADSQPDVKRFRRESVDEGEAEVRQTWQDKSCKCLVAFAGDCAALCCCPCTILHLFALICIRVPLTVLYGMYSRVRRRKGRSRKFDMDIDATVVAKQVRSSFNTWPFGEQLVIDFPPYPGGFGDQKYWSFFESGSEGSVGSPNKQLQALGNGS